MYQNHVKMNALEFSVQIEQGVIRLPLQYQAYNNAEARIIVLVKTPPVVRSQKERLAAIFTKMKQIKMFETIQNPTLWQKQLRNEWE